MCSSAMCDTASAKIAGNRQSSPGFQVDEWAPRRLNDERTGTTGRRAFIRVPPSTDGELDQLRFVRGQVFIHDATRAAQPRASTRNALLLCIGQLPLHS